MKIRHVLRGRANPANADGLVYHTYHLSHAQRALGHDVEVYGIVAKLKEPQVIDRDGLTVRAFPVGRHPFAVHASVGQSLSLPELELMHIHKTGALIRASVSLGALCAYMLQGNLWQRSLLLMAVVPLAMAGNMVRIVAILLLARSWGQEVAEGFYHEFSGVVVFLVTFALLIALARLLGMGKTRKEAC